MGIETSFKFAHAHSSDAHAAADKSLDRVESLTTTPPGDILGHLRGFVGPKGKRLWKGKGFNLIWRPNFSHSLGTQDFALELNLTDETLEFTDISGTGVANRGFLDDDLFMGAVAYLQQVSDVTGPQHFEPGVWTSARATKNPAEPSTVVRMGSIPHGTVINLQGIGLQAPQPKIDPTSITPFQIGSTDDGATNLVPFPEENNVQTKMPSRTDPAQLPGLDDAHLQNPNLFLTDVLAKQTVLSTTVLIVSSEPKSAKAPADEQPPDPDAGGGTANMAFLVGTASGPNAGPERVNAVFWIERVRDKDGKEFDQLQYTQRVLLNFNGLSWPHVSVATLVPVPDVYPLSS